MAVVFIPTREEFGAAIRAFEEKERRRSVYFEALGLIQNGWGDADKMADGIERLERSWNRIFYWGRFERAPIRQCIESNMSALQAFHDRDIRTLSQQDQPGIRDLFNAFTKALVRPRDGAPSGVSTAKALHLLAPGFLPLWDSSIAFRYGCLLTEFGSTYLSFCWQMKTLAESTSDYIEGSDDRTLVKRVDEFNYSAYTFHWIQVGAGHRVEVDIP